ncbi:MAG TPA: lysylphosphatidylglycerol synthase transmembrane domain-containing protein [Elusimicrobiota bacterium]|nr:lysylphosphatidylglycerol synthase transmembrane domain-containing protein [Elusimicrobiota bacterium]
MTALRWLLALGISVAGLWFALHGADWETMSATVKNLRSPFWLAFFPLVVLFEFTVRSIRWKLLLDPLKPAPLKVLFPITNAAFFINNVLPFRAGEFARIYWTSQKTGVPLSSCVAVLAVDRLFDMATLLTMTFFVLLNKSALFQSRKPIVLFATVTLGLLAAMALLARFPAPFKSWMEKPAVPRFLTRWAHQFIEGSQALRSTSTFLLAYLLSLSFWTVFILVLRFLASLFSFSLSFTDAAFIEIAMCFGVLLPSAPGYVGTLEAAGVAAFAMLGFDRNVALPFLLIVHFSQIMSTVVLGIPSLWIAGLKVHVPAADRPAP